MIYDGKTPLLKEAPNGIPCHYIHGSDGARGYIPYTAAEIQAHQAWLASLPAKRERRSVLAAQRRRDGLIALKAELADLPNGGALKSRAP